MPIRVLSAIPPRADEQCLAVAYGLLRTRQSGESAMFGGLQPTSAGAHGLREMTRRHPLVWCWVVEESGP